jgi:hypothetical protein
MSNQHRAIRVKEKDSGDQYQTRLYESEGTSKKHKPDDGAAAVSRSSRGSYNRMESTLCHGLFTLTPLCINHLDSL